MATLSVTTAAFIMEIQQGPGGAASVRLCEGWGRGAGPDCVWLPLPGSPSPTSLSQGGGVGIPSSPGQGGYRKPHLPPRKLFLGFSRLQLEQWTQ